MIKKGFVQNEACMLHSTQEVNCWKAALVDAS